MSSFGRISRINYCADLCADSADASINRAIIAQNSSHKRNFRPRATTWGHRNPTPSPTGIALKETGVWMSRPTKGVASSSRLQVPVGSGERTFVHVHYGALTSEKVPPRSYYTSKSEYSGSHFSVIKTSSNSSGHSNSKLVYCNLSILV